MLNSLFNAIEARKEELFELLGNLIRINSENFGATGNEKECAEYIYILCQELGLETDLYSPLSIADFENHPDYWGGRNLETRYDVTARWAGVADEDDLMLAAHSDTMPIGDLSAWSFNPLAGLVKDGKIWGRGACDDKYGIASALFLIKLLKELGFKPKKNILFTAYSDEEYGGSNGALAACLKYPCSRIINMDCKAFEIWHCAAGGQVVSARIHSTEPLDSCSKVARALTLVMNEIDEFGKKRREELSRNEFYTHTAIPETSLRYMGVKAGNEGSDLDFGEVSFVFYTDKTKEEISAEYRDMEMKLREKLHPLGIECLGFIPTTRFFHYIYADKNNPSITGLVNTARQVSSREIPVCGSCLSDLSIFLKYGSKSAFGFGLGRPFNEYGGAHQYNEYLGCDDFVEFTKMIGAYILEGSIN